MSVRGILSTVNVLSVWCAFTQLRCDHLSGVDGLCIGLSLLTMLIVIPVFVLVYRIYVPFDDVDLEVNGNATYATTACTVVAPSIKPSKLVRCAFDDAHPRRIMDRFDEYMDVEHDDVSPFQSDLVTDTGRKPSDKCV
jgi:hypothetical protein